MLQVGVNGVKTNIATCYFVVKSFSVVPVRLASFSATILPDRNIQISWTDQTPVDNALFIVQESNDGATFKDIGSVVEQAGVKEYSFVFQNTSCGKKFFRLSLGGNYSDVRTVVLPCDVLITGSGQTLYIQTQTSGVLTLINFTGQIIWQTSLSSGNKQVTFSVPRGAYVARFVSDKGVVSTQKVVLR